MALLAVSTVVSSSRNPLYPKPQEVIKPYYCYCHCEFFYSDSTVCSFLAYFFQSKLSLKKAFGVQSPLRLPYLAGRKSASIDGSWRCTQ